MKPRKIALSMGVLCLVVALVLTGCALPGSSSTSKFPTGPVTLVVGFGAGGGVDTAARGIVPYFQKYLGVSVVVENRPGATGLIAANYVMDSKADGYTLFVETNGTSLMAQLYSDSWKGTKQMHDAFITIYSWVNADGNGLFVKKGSPFNSMADIAAEAQKRPIKFGIAGGLGSTDQITVFCVRKAYGGTWNIIPNDSGADVVAGVLGGTYDIGSGSPNAAAFDPAQLKMLAVTMQKRSTRFPDAPTVTEIGKPQCSSQFAIGAAAPLGTPQDVIDTLAAAFDKARNDPEYIAWAQKANQPIGDKGWDGKTFYTFLKDYWTNMQAVVPDLQEEVKKAQQGTTPTPTK